ncbi:hypothetical protein SOVF_053340 [Spinacia oleracea]|nr:hypothetical protein SOVF_053340 [Spinacia oleracea]
MIRCTLSIQQIRTGLLTKMPTGYNYWHVELAKNFVQGHLIQSAVGITTRSKAKSAPDQWTVMAVVG